MAIDPNRVKELFMAVSEAAPDEREALLDRQCAGDAELRQRVQALLQAHEEPDSFLRKPRGEVTAAYQPALGLQVGQTFAGRFKLREAIGQGGMGAVFVADQMEPVQRRVALKVIRAGAESARMLARFEQERQALALMDHPNIAKVLDAGIAGEPGATGVPYFVMELIKGVPLTQYCDEARLTPSQRLELFVPVCHAVQHAHQKGLIHRDLKPSNILVGLYDGKPVPKVIDFGVAKATGQRLSEHSVYTEVGSVIGTLEYMSPEQAELNNLDIDTRSDIYALGVILYQLLTGTVPFSRKELEASGFAEMLRIIKEKEPPKPSTRLSASRELSSVAAQRQMEPGRLSKLLRGELDWIVMKALEKDRNRRYETANGFALDVQRYLAGEPVLAAPPSKSYRLRKFARKHSAALATTATIIVLLTAGVAVSSWLAVRAMDAEQTARAAEANARQSQQREAEQRQNAQISAANARAAAAAEKTAKDAALAREAEIKAVLDFVDKKVFAAARPKDQEGGLGYDVRLADAVKAAVPFVEKSFSGQPLIEAQLRYTLGQSFYYLGDFKTAIEQEEKARALCTEHLGVNNTNTLWAMNNLALSYGAAGRLQDAIKLDEETLERRKAILGPDHADTLVSMNNLGLDYAAASRTEEAVKLFEEALRACKAKLGPDHPDTFCSTVNLGVVYVKLGRHTDVINLLEPALPVMRAKMPYHMFTVNCMNNLAIAYNAVLRAQDAIKLFEETLQLRKATLGPDHPVTLQTMTNLAIAYIDTGRIEEGIKLHEETLRLQKDKLGSDHPATLASMVNLGNGYLDLGRFNDAIKLFKEALPIMRTKMPGHQFTFNCMNNLASCLIQVGHKQEALNLFEELQQLRKAKLGLNHPDTLQNMNNLADLYVDAGETAKAMTLLQEILAVRERRVKADPGNSFEQAFLAWTHGQIGDAEQERLNYVSAASAYAKSLEVFNTLDRAGALKHPFFRDRFDYFQGRLAWCQRLEQAVKDLDYALKQPALEVPKFLNRRVRYLLKEQKMPAAVDTAAKMKELAADNADHLYNAACLYALCAAGKDSNADAARLTKQCADEAMALLNQAITKGYADAAHMKQDKDLDALRQREDFQKLLAALQATKP